MLAFEDRYTRQRQLPQVGISGQVRLCEMRVELAEAEGCAVAAEYLERAGTAQVRVSPEAEPRSCPHEEFFRFAGPREVGLGAHLALRCMLEQLSAPPQEST